MTGPLVAGIGDSGVSFRHPLQEKGRGVPTAPFPPALRSCRLEHGQDSCRLGVRRCDSLKVCSNRAQLAIDECVHEMQSPIQPREKYVFNLVVHGQGDFGAVRPHFREIDNSRQVEIAIDGFENDLIRRIAMEAEQNGVTLETEGTPKGKIDRFR
jgi:hypothetical protein